MGRKQKHIVMARTTDIMSQGIETSKGKKKFGKHSVMWVDDAGEAKEIEKRYKGKVAVTLDQQYTWSVNNDGGNGTRMDNIHNYTFQGVDMAGIRTTKDNGWVWVWKGGRQVRVRREEAEQEGYEIVQPKKKREVKENDV